jgi:hypothetical protein
VNDPAKKLSDDIIEATNSLSLVKIGSRRDELVSQNYVGSVIV